MKMTDFTGKSWMAIGETDDPNAVVESFEAAAAVAKGDPVYLSAALCEQCPVITRGRVKVKAGDAITRGKAVFGADASNRVLELTDQAVDENGSTSYTVYYNRKLGTALETTTAADDLLFIQV